MTLRHFAAAFCALAALCASAQGIAKKVIATGWDTLRMSPEEVLANASAFADTGIDGINLTFSTTVGGRKMGFNSIFSNVEFRYDDLKKYVPVFQKIAVSPGLKDSLLTVYWTPRPEQRIKWSDDAGWRIVANNMGVMAKLAKEGGLKGLFLDWEDYGNAGQFTRKEEDPEMPETIRLARQRGREIGKAVFDEFPDVAFFSYWWLCSSGWIAQLCAEERDYALSKAVWPAFVNGLLDVMPDGARLIDGREHYHLESFRRDFYEHASRIQAACLGLVAPENRAKYRRAISVSFGHYLDMYTNPETEARWYYGPEGGSRLEHFRRNLEQSFCAASEYVWIYGEKGLFVPLTGCANGWIAKQQTWEEKLPGWQEAVKRVKRECGVAPSEVAARKTASSAAKAPQPRATPMKKTTSYGKKKDGTAKNQVAPDPQGNLPKKFIAAGASVRARKPKELLELAEEFAVLGFDGVAVSLNMTDNYGVPMGSEGIGSRNQFSAMRQRLFVDDLKAMAAHDGLKESLIYVNMCPAGKNRVPWGSEKRWAAVAVNMGIMAKMAKAAGLKGLFLDASDRDGSRQFVVTEREKGYRYDTLVSDARRHGRAVGKAVFAAYPDIVLFSTGWFSAEGDLADPSEEPLPERLRKRGTLWPAFVNGILDEMPATARLVDGCGNGAREASKKDFYKVSSDMFVVSRALVAEENAAKMLTALSPASGETLGRYQGDNADSLFWRNLAQAADASSEYVWIDVGDAPVAGKGAEALDRRLPGWRDVVFQVKDERGWIRRYLKEHAGSARDLVPDPTCACGISKGYFAYIDKKTAPDAVIDTDNTVGEGDSVSFRMTRCGLDGTLMFRVQGVKPNDVYIVQFSTKGYGVSAKASWREDSAFRWNVPSVGLPVAAENAAGWRTASRLVRAPDMNGYNEMYLMIDARGAGKDDVAWVDNIHVYKVK